MAGTRVLLQVLVAAVSLALYGCTEDDFGFGADVAKHFVMPPAPSHVHETAAETGKPVMVILMTKASPHCGALRKAIKNGSKVKALLDSFTVAYAEESIHLWAGEDDKYVPQVMFFSGGERLGVESGHKGGKYLYQDEAKLEAAMVEALAQSKAGASSQKGPSCQGGTQCTGIDEKDMCEFTDGCTWGKPKKEKKEKKESDDSAPLGCSGGEDCNDIDDKDMCEPPCTWNSGGSSGPCQGGSQCNDIDDKDMCEFTDGCSWSSDEDEDDFEDNDDGSSGASSTEHSFDKDLEAKMMVDASPSEVRQEAKKQNKPFMVLLTQSWCGPCKDLIKSINIGSSVKYLLDSFVMTHASGDSGIVNWQATGEQYVPQAYFYTAEGKLLEVPGPNDKFKHFFENEDQLAFAMRTALKKVSKTSGEL